MFAYVLFNTLFELKEIALDPVLYHSRDLRHKSTHAGLVQ